MHGVILARLCRAFFAWLLGYAACKQGLGPRTELAQRALEQLAMVIHHIFGVEGQSILVHSAYLLNDFLVLPYATLSHSLQVKSRCTQSPIPITEDPDALLV